MRFACLSVVFAACWLVGGCVSHEAKPQRSIKSILELDRLSETDYIDLRKSGFGRNYERMFLAFEEVCLINRDSDEKRNNSLRIMGFIPRSEDMMLWGDAAGEAVVTMARGNYGWCIFMFDTATNLGLKVTTDDMMNSRWHAPSVTSTKLPIELFELVSATWVGEADIGARRVRFLPSKIEHGEYRPPTLSTSMP